MAALGVALYLFGSTARDEAGSDSDVDLFIDYNLDRFDVVELFRLEQALARGLGHPVSLVTREGLHPQLRAEVDREAVRVIP